MDRGWYFRFSFVLVLVVAAWFALWPSLDTWIPAPGWVKDNFTRRISPGLDIQGGLRLMYEVEVDEAIRDRRDRMSNELLGQVGELLGILEEGDALSATREQLDEVREKLSIETVEDRGILITFEDAADAEKLDRQWLQERFPILRQTSREGAVVSLDIREERLEELRDEAVQQAVKTIQNRVDEMQVREMTVIGRDTDIIVEIPGADVVSRLVNAIVPLAEQTEAVDGQHVIQITEAEIAERAGLEPAPMQEAVSKLTEAGREFVFFEDTRIVIPDLDRLRQQSAFERVRSVISRTAQLEFKVLEDESSFVADLSDLPEGIEKQTERTSAGESRPEVVSTFLVARGEGSRQRLGQYISTLEAPENRELLIGAHEEEGEPGETREDAWRTYYVFATSEVTGEHVEDAFVGYDSQDQSKPVVQLQFQGTGADAFERMTGANVKRRMAIVLDNRVESAPVINERIGGGRCQITLGSYRDPQVILSEANELVIVLKAGALPAPIRPSNEQLIGPTLGRDSVAKGAQGGLIGVALVLIFMLIYYQVAGIVADVMVLLNILFLLSALAALEATLTLPGVAGIALTVGMAVDANVLITERIREELRLGKSPRSAVDQGFRRAFWSIFDAQLTTFIAGVVLYQYGTGPIKGFAVTLMIGIATSLFTGVFCSKVMLDWIVRGLRVQRLRVG